MLMSRKRKTNTRKRERTQSGRVATYDEYRMLRREGFSHPTAQEVVSMTTTATVEELLLDQEMMQHRVKLNDAYSSDMKIFLGVVNRELKHRGEAKTRLEDVVDPDTQRLSDGSTVDEARQRIADINPER